jgi:hypothetical protein
MRDLFHVGWSGHIILPLIALGVYVEVRTMEEHWGSSAMSIRPVTDTVVRAWHGNLWVAVAFVFYVVSLCGAGRGGVTGNPCESALTRIRGTDGDL